MEPAVRARVRRDQATGRRNCAVQDACGRRVSPPGPRAARRARTTCRRALTGCDYLEGLSQPATIQPRGRRVLSDALTQSLRQRLWVLDLATVRSHGGDFSIERLGDIHIVVDLPLRAVDQPHLPNSPGLQPFLLLQVSK